MKRTFLNIVCFDLGDGDKEKQTATQIQQQQNHPFSENDCKPSIEWCSLQTCSTWVVQIHK